MARNDTYVETTFAIAMLRRDEFRPALLFGMPNNRRAEKSRAKDAKRASAWVAACPA